MSSVPGRTLLSSLHGKVGTLLTLPMNPNLNSRTSACQPLLNFGARPSARVFMGYSALQRAHVARGAAPRVRSAWMQPGT